MEELVIGLTKIVFLLIFQIFLLYRKIPQIRCRQIMQKVLIFRFRHKKACNNLLQAQNIDQIIQLFSYYFKFNFS